MVGLTEAPESSWLLLTRFLGICDGAPAALCGAVTLNAHAAAQRAPTNAAGAAASTSPQMSPSLRERAHRATALDDRFYEAATRILCERLTAAGLADHPVVRQELYSNGSLRCTK